MDLNLNKLSFSFQLSYGSVVLLDLLWNPLYRLVLFFSNDPGSFENTSCDGLKMHVIA